MSTLSSQEGKRLRSGPCCMVYPPRGKFRSKPWQAVLDEARALVAGGVKELNLIAEDTNQYGMDRWGRGMRQEGRGSPVPGAYCTAAELGRDGGCCWRALPTTLLRHARDPSTRPRRHLHLKPYTVSSRSTRTPQARRPRPGRPAA